MKICLSPTQLFYEFLLYKIILFYIVDMLFILKLHNPKTITLEMSIFGCKVSIVVFSLHVSEHFLTSPVRVCTPRRQDSCS